MSDIVLRYDERQHGSNTFRVTFPRTGGVGLDMLVSIGGHTRWLSETAFLSQRRGHEKPQGPTLERIDETTYRVGVWKYPKACEVPPSTTLLLVGVPADLFASAAA